MIAPDDVRIDWADGYPAWVLVGDKSYPVITQELLQDAQRIARGVAALYDTESGDIEDFDAIHAYEDAGIDLARRLAEYFSLDGPVLLSDEDAGAVAALDSDPDA